MNSAQSILTSAFLLLFAAAAPVASSNAQGVGYCFGDPGSGTPCPCANDNDGSVRGSGCDNGVFASGAQLTGSGIASVNVDTLILSTTHLEPGNAGLYFQADNDLSPGNVWGDGLRCAGGNLKRHRSQVGRGPTQSGLPPPAVRIRKARVFVRAKVVTHAQIAIQFAGHGERNTTT